VVKLIFCLRRRPELSREEFQRYWRENHAGLVREHAETLRMRRYVQAHTISSATGDALRASRGAPDPFDGVAELWWDEVADIDEAAATRDGRTAARALLEDERRFIDLDRSPVWLAHEYELFGRP
jgi:uncharacterized protein (TIGR02118 family)